MVPRPTLVDGWRRVSRAMSNARAVGEVDKSWIWMSRSHQSIRAVIRQAKDRSLEESLWVSFWTISLRSLKNSVCEVVVFDRECNRNLTSGLSM